MARQTEDRTEASVARRPVWIGVDPGDRWCGYAKLERRRGIRGIDWKLDMSVFDRQAFPSFLDLTDTLSDQGYRGILLVERYQHRPTGDQAWSVGETQQLIGALRYTAERLEAEFREIHPGDPYVLLQELQMIHLFDVWLKRCAKNVPWVHALSACRVMFHYLMVKQPEIMIDLQRTDFTKVKCPMQTLGRPGVARAPQLQWLVKPGRLVQEEIFIKP